MDPWEGRGMHVGMACQTQTRSVGWMYACMCYVCAYVTWNALTRQHACTHVRTDTSPRTCGICSQVHCERTGQHDSCDVWRAQGNQSITALTLHNAQSAFLQQCFFTTLKFQTTISKTSPSLVIAAPRNTQNIWEMLWKYIYIYIYIYAYDFVILPAQALEPHRHPLVSKGVSAIEGCVCP